MAPITWIIQGTNRVNFSQLPVISKLTFVSHRTTEQHCRQQNCLRASFDVLPNVRATFSYLSRYYKPQHRE